MVEKRSVVEMEKRDELGKIIKQQRVMSGLTLQQLAQASGVSYSHLSRIEGGDRFPSAHILCKIAKPLGFSEGELFVFAGYLPSQVEREAEVGKLDPYVARVLSQEPVEVQRTVIAILSIFKSMARGSGCNIEFAEYAHRKYPELDEDIITMIEDLIKRQRQDRKR
ncbi:hypothetical protein ES705_10138 [subsurface metagenome]